MLLFPAQQRFALISLCFITTLLAGASSYGQLASTPSRATDLMEENRPRLTEECAEKGLTLGDPIFIRIFKLSGELEVWIEKENRFHLFRTYPICNYSGFLGPKLREGDWQSPEGFYTVSASQLNPESQYHLSFNIGYPNRFDQENDRTGSSIMVHGGCSSQGCFAMGNYRMEEIYLLAHSALSNGQENFSVHIFPFKMSAMNLEKYGHSPWIDFWENLKPGFDAFAATHQVPIISLTNNKSYEVNRTVQMARAESEGKRDL